MCPTCKERTQQNNTISEHHLTNRWSLIGEDTIMIAISKISFVLNKHRKSPSKRHAGRALGYHTLLILIMFMLMYIILFIIQENIFKISINAYWRCMTFIHMIFYVSVKEIFQFLGPENVDQNLFLKHFCHSTAKSLVLEQIQICRVSQRLSHSAIIFPISLIALEKIRI